MFPTYVQLEGNRRKRPKELNGLFVIKVSIKVINTITIIPDYVVII